MKRITSLLVCLAFVGLSAFSQDIQITGKVTSADDGSLLPGVSVVVKGTTTGTSTSVDGEYAISAPSDAVLIFSSIGMKTIEIEVGNQTTIDVAMEAEATGLDEIVVVGYGTRRKGAVTGSVGFVGGEELEQSSIVSFDQVLQGRSTGVQVINSSGRPGADAIVRIRGISTINASTDPLFVIDGVTVESGQFAEINPNDIESISILKDAMAAVYGSKAANGVVLITTKQGKKGDTKINYRYYTGWSDMTKPDMNMMNTAEKLQYEIDAGWRTGASATQEVLDSLLEDDHDWFETITRTGKTNSHELSFSGGTDKTTFYISGNYFEQEGLTAGSFYDKITGRINLQHKATDKLKFGLNTTVGYSERGELRDRRNVQNPFYAAMIYNPYEPLKNDDGTWNLTHSGFNVVESLEKNTERLQQIKGISSFFLDWEILEGLTFTTRAGIDFRESTRQTFTMPSSILAGYVGDFMRDEVRRYSTQTYTNMLSYSKGFGDHNIGIRAAMEAQKYWFKSTLIGVQGFASDKLAVPGAAAEAVDAGGTILEWGLMSYFGTINYNFANKYIVDLIGRSDASSRFGENNQRAPFGAVGVAWNITKEDFLQNITVLTNLKIRASYGTSGNFRYIDGTGTEPYYQHLGTYAFTAYGRNSASYPSKIENPDLKWEVVTTTDVGFDFGILSNRLRGEFSYYNRVTDDLFFPRQTSLTSGFDEKVENVGSMLNKGIEIALSGDVVQSSGILWTVGASITTVKNEITSLYGSDDQQLENGFGILKKGEPVYQYYLVRYAGVNTANGDALYYDKDGYVTNSFSDEDRVILDKSPLPKYFGSITTRVEYKGIDLNALFYYSGGNYIFSYYIYSQESDGTNIKDNQSREMLNAWKKPGDITDIPQTRLGNDRAFDTDRNLEVGDYLRLRDVTLGYTLPTNFVNKIKLQKLRIYAKGTNLLTFTNYRGFDPEIGNNSSESAITPVGSFDENTYPTIKTFTIGIDVGF